jgi:hypothetical protein
MGLLFYHGAYQQGVKRQGGKLPNEMFFCQSLVLPDCLLTIAKL